MTAQPSEASGFDRPGKIQLESIVRYVPEVIKPGMSPADPTKYSAALLLQPVEWLIGWWRRRPIAKLFDVVDQYGRVESYRSVISRLFGDRDALVSDLQNADWRRFVTQD